MLPHRLEEGGRCFPTSPLCLHRMYELTALVIYQSGLELEPCRVYHELGPPSWDRFEGSDRGILMHLAQAPLVTLGIALPDLLADLKIEKINRSHISVLRDIARLLA